MATARATQPQTATGAGLAAVEEEEAYRFAEGNASGWLEPQGRDLLVDWIRAIAVYPLLSAEEERTLAERKDSDRAAFERLYLCNQRLVVAVAKRYTGMGVAYEDLIAEGRMGLWHAIEKFDVAMGYKLSTYATIWIRQHCDRAVIMQTEALHIPVNVYPLYKRLRAALWLGDLFVPSARRDGGAGITAGAAGTATAVDPSAVAGARVRHSAPEGLAAETGVPLERVRELMPLLGGTVSLSATLRANSGPGTRSDGPEGEFAELVADESVEGSDPLETLTSAAATARETLRYLLDERHDAREGQPLPHRPGGVYRPLSEKERAVLRLRYLPALDADGDRVPQVTQDEAGRLLGGFTHQRVQQLEERAIAKLRDLVALLGLTSDDAL